MKSAIRIVPALLGLSATGWSGAVTTVPWNGHKGAITFTFDDGCSTHLTNVLPALKDRKLTATFFLIGNSDFSSRKEQWKAAALEGHELANHTTLHDDPRSLDSAKIATEIGDQAKALRAVDPAVEAVTLAYPYCGTNDMVNRIADRENIIARTCGGSGLFAWNSVPSEWMSMTSFILQDDASVPDALKQIDKAASDNSWLVTLNHGIGGDWNFIGTTQAISMFDRAVASKAWVATYQTVAAYWRASKTMDTVKASPFSAGWDLRWTSPHPRMPRSVKLRVKLDTNVFRSSPNVTQDGTPIAREADGSYVIEFMKLALNVFKSSSATPRRSHPHQPTVVRSNNLGEWHLEGIEDGVYSYALLQADGTRIGEGNLVARGRSATVTSRSDSPRADVLELRSLTGQADRSLIRLPALR
ncbi:MAG TPA: polysaccharide deacetylase family protein [Fibrobacteria bacterium]|nr:polysaccharide deacetylase family protein [Fibrobacteria bacterium]HOX50590.1 polysaccharide deacetylase family protein [Fibrobacteria bacterium]